MPRTFSINTSTQENDTPVEWVKWYDSVKAVGDTFTITAERLHFKEASNAFFIINESENIGTSVFVEHHPSSKFTDSTPDGIRLASALGRHLKVKGDITAEDLMAIATEALPLTITCEYTEKGRLWTVGA